MEVRSISRSIVGSCSEQNHAREEPNGGRVVVANCVVQYLRWPGNRRLVIRNEQYQEIFAWKQDRLVDQQ